MTSAKAYWIDEAGRGEIRAEPFTVPSGNNLALKTLFTGISPGTERLVGLGRVPTPLRDTMRCAHMAGSFDFPVKYGYSLVGQDQQGQRRFVMHPHQDHICVNSERTIVLPATLPPERAILFPAMETALNGIWDADTFTPEQAVVVGGGLIGVLIAFQLTQRTGKPTGLIEASAERRQFLEQLPWLKPLAPEDAGNNCPGSTHAQTLFHCSSSAAGLQWAIDNSAFEASIIELSWYGTQKITLDLGGHFHQQRKRLISSQVSEVAAPKRSTESRESRAREVLSLLDDQTLDQLLYPRIQFNDLPDFMAALYRQQQNVLAPVVEYGPADSEELL